MKDTQSINDNQKKITQWPHPFFIHQHLMEGMLVLQQQYSDQNAI